MWKQLLIFTLVFLKITSALKYGETCRPLSDPKCDEFLACINVGVAQYECRCDLNVTIERPDSEPPCIVLPDKVGSPCEELEDENFCRWVPGEAICLDGFCACNETTHFPISTGSCVPYAEKLHASCSYSDECDNIEGAVCLDLSIGKGTCQCNPSSYFEHLEEEECKEYARMLGDFCEEGLPYCSKLGDGVGCVNETCDCISEFVPHPDLEKCLPLVHALGAPCTPGAEQCSSIEGASCENTCKCNASSYVSHFPQNRCILLPEGLNSSCTQGTIPEHCSMIANAACLGLGSNLICSCQAGFVEDVDGVSCVRVQTKLEAPCQVDRECSGIKGEAVCDGNRNRCDCNQTHVSVVMPDEGEPDKCLKIAEVNGTCEDTIQCRPTMGSEAECHLTTGSCGCAASAGYWDNGCYKKIQVGSVCSVDQECFVGSNQNAVCIPLPANPMLTVCQCSPDSEFVPTNFVCLRNLKLGEGCISQQECEHGISGVVVCSSGRCSCGIGSVPNANLTMCRSIGVKDGGSMIFVWLFGLALTVFLK